MEPVLTIYIYI